MNMSNYYFIFYFMNEDKLKNIEDLKMCKKLEELSRYNVETLYRMFDEEFSNIPVDIHAILTKLGIEYGAVDFSKIEGNFDGIILPQQADMVMGAVAAYSSSVDDKDGVEISVNKNDSYHRQRFTLAHELAHCMLHSDSLRDGRVELRTSITSTEPREEQANILAGKLLIPEKILKVAYASMPIPFLSLLANKFDVSDNVMAARLNYLNMGSYTI